MCNRIARVTRLELHSSDSKQGGRNHRAPCMDPARSYRRSNSRQCLGLHNLHMIVILF